MGLVKFAEQRIAERKVPKGLLPGKLQMKTGKLIDCVVKNISPQGMGIESTNRIPVGSELSLHSGDKIVSRLRVQWQKPGFGRRDVFLYGLVVIDESDIEKIFTRADLLIVEK